MKTLLRTIAVVFLLAISVQTAYGQIVLRGTVTTDTGETAAFANVLLCNPKDSTDVIASAVVDMQGTYSLPPQQEGRYTAIVQLTGYKTINEDIMLRQPSHASTANEMVRDFVLETDVEQIESVMVEANNVTQHLDRTVYDISREDRKLAVTALDLTLKVPQLRLDPMTQKLASQDGALSIFINGAASTEQELKSLRPEDIKSMEYYDLPPMRYGGGTTKVINVITKGAVEGIYGGIDLSHAFTTGFFNDSFYLRYNRGRSQLALSYFGSYRNYHDVEDRTEYDYTLLGTDYSRRQYDHRPFHYLDNAISLQYTNQVQDKYLFQANFSPNIFTRRSEKTSKIDYMVGNTSSVRSGTFELADRSFAPSLSMYLWKQLDKRQEIIANLVGTYFDAASDYTSEEYSEDNELVLSDFQRMNNHKYSVIGQAVYVKNFDHLSLSAGERFSFESLSTHLDNTFANDKYRTQVITTNTYAELTGRHFGNKLQYRVSIGATGRHTSSREVKSWDWVFTPSVTIGYQFMPTLMLRAGFSQSNTSPSLSQISNSASLISDNIVSRGNPYLKSGFRNTTYLGVSYNNDWLYLYLTGSFNYAKNPISSYFIEGEQYMELVQENARFSRTYGLSYTVQINPFHNRLIVLTAQGGLFRQQSDSGFAGKYDLFTTPLTLMLNINWKNFTAYYQWGLRTYSLGAPYLSLNEPISYAGIQYRYKDWTFSVSCVGLLTEFSYISKTIPDSAVKYYSKSVIHDNENMLLVSVGFQFGKGRVYEERGRAIDNADTDSGL